MRLWHKDLIPVLPRNQLVGQWRECCAIAKGIAETGKTNHILINRIMEYHLGHFYAYCAMVRNEMWRRGYHCDADTLTRWVVRWKTPIVTIERPEKVFCNWHNDRYLRQCHYNLQEKYDCGGISAKEFDKIETVYNPSRDG